MVVVGALDVQECVCLWHPTKCKTFVTRPFSCAMSWIAAVPGIIVNFETAIGHGTLLWPAQ